MARLRQSRAGSLARTVAAQLLISLVAATSSVALEQSLYDRPTLVADPGIHTGIIRSSAIDKAGQFFVTGSEDKTVRIWSVDKPKDKTNLLHTIRMPAVPGYPGSVYAVAMAPEGDLIAAGGWTRADTAEESVYLFDRSGAVVKQVGNLPDVVNKLVFSPDGRYLAVASDDGLYVFDRTKEWAEAFRDTAYGGVINGITFSSDGRLAAASYDGKIRLYGPDFELLLPPKSVTSGQQPYNIAFRPDGGALAIGYDDVAVVDILAADDLGTMPGPAVVGLPGSLPHVSWSQDGRTLFAGKQVVYAWSDGGRGQRRVLRGGNDTLMSLNPLPDGGLLIATADPLIKRFKSDDTIDWQHTMRPVELGNQSGVLAVSDDGLIVDFGLGQGGNPRLRFDLRTDANRPLMSHNPARDDGATRPAKTDGLNVRRRDHSAFFEDKVIEIDKAEKVRAIAISHDNRRFVVGGTWSLRGRNSNNERLWRRDVPDVWAINISGNGRLLVAAYDDGSIRWHDMDSGQELLTLLVLLEPDQLNWVAWTPEGFYAATAGAVRVLQWHVNQGIDAAGRAVYAYNVPQLHRPDVLALALSERGIGQKGLRDAQNARAAVQKITGSAKPPGARLHVLAIGISKYPVESLKLNFAHKDAEDLIKKLFDSQGNSSSFPGSGGLYAEVIPYPLIDKDATSEQILYQTDAVSKAMAKEDTAIVMFSGHGTTIDGKFYLLPFDTNISRGNLSIKGSAISAEKFKEWIQPLTRLGRVLVLLDACRSGAATAKTAHDAMMGGEFAMLTSSTGTQLSREDKDWQNGAFTKAFVEALSDPSVDANNNNVISMSELTDYLERRLPELTNQAQQLGRVHTLGGNLFSTGL
jgi:WD40 repeat protein